MVVMLETVVLWMTLAWQWINATSRQEDINLWLTYQSSLVNTEESDGPEILINEEIIAHLPKNNAPLRTYSDFVERWVDDYFTDLRQEIRGQGVNLDVPFFPQAPVWNRSLPRKEACEETSLVLVAYYLQGKSLTLEGVQAEVLDLVAREERLFGSAVDTSLAQTAQLYEQKRWWTTTIVENPTVTELKHYLDQWVPIVAPFAGQQLGNSYFTQWGPRYHMMVLRGYDDTYFFTNEVGSIRGNNFPYTYGTIMEALHDFVPVEQWAMEQWPKRVLILEPTK